VTNLRGSARLRTVAGTVAAIGAGVLMAPLAGLGGFGGSPVSYPVQQQSGVRHVLHDVTELTFVRPADGAVAIATRPSGANRAG
jgi:hypothetical protein